MSTQPVPSLDLIRRTIDTEAAYTLSRMRVLEAIAGNPVGIAYRKAGKNGWALMARHLPVPSFNAVIGLGPGDDGEVEGVLRWYADRGGNTQFEIVPGLDDAKLLRELAHHGYRHSGFHASVIARPGDAVAPDPAIDVERVSDRATFEHFLDAYIAGRSLPDGEGFKRNVRPWLDQRDWSLFLGRVGGKPAAAACDDRSGLPRARPADRAAGAPVAACGGARRKLRVLGRDVSLKLASQHGARRHDASIRPRAVDARQRVMTVGIPPQFAAICSTMKTLLKPDGIVLVPESDEECAALSAWKAAHDDFAFMLAANRGTGAMLTALGPCAEACREPINVWSQSPDPQVRLIANFAPTPFEIDGARYASVESFWQSLRFPPQDRARIAALDGARAKHASEEQSYGDHIVYGDLAIPVGTWGHWQLMKRACRAKFSQNADARAALLATGTRPLIHKVRTDSRTIPGAVMADIWMAVRTTMGRRETAEAEE